MRWPIGTVCILAARLRADAKDGQILVGGRAARALEETIALQDVGTLALKGLTQPVSGLQRSCKPCCRCLRGDRWAAEAGSGSPVSFII